MKTDDVLKALEQCRCLGCINCPYFTAGTAKCVDDLMEDAADIINHQKTEIEGLQKRIVYWREDMDYHPEKERVEAIKGFAEKLKQTRVDIGGIEIVAVGNIDSLVKEMTEGHHD